MLPLKAGTHERAAALLGQRPPFDPEDTALERRQVFLTDREAVFVFEGDMPDALDKLTKGRTFLGEAAAWEELVAGPPRLANEAFSWVRPHPDEYTSSMASPGPGDSEGGDVYAPDARD